MRERKRVERIFVRRILSTLRYTCRLSALQLFQIYFIEKEKFFVVSNYCYYENWIQTPIHQQAISLDVCVCVCLTGAGGAAANGRKYVEAI